MKPKITICRVYSPPPKKEGLWVLVDRLWPRGIKKEALDLDLWLKELAPSTELRKWFNHDAEKWPEFQQRYLDELKSKKEAIELLFDKAQHAPITLFYGAKDTKHNQALVLQAVLQAWPELPESLPGNA